MCINPDVVLLEIGVHERIEFDFAELFAALEVCMNFGRLGFEVWDGKIITKKVDFCGKGRATKDRR